MSEERLIIESFREDGSKFRPSDWIDRLSACLAHFGNDHRLDYARELHPCIIDGERCLVVSRNLDRHHPQVLDYILDFARSNGLRIQVDRRTDARALPAGE